MLRKKKPLQRNTNTVSQGVGSRPLMGVFVCFDGLSIMGLHKHVYTNMCNLRCIHCYVESGDKSKFHFTGGEPLLRDDIFELINYTSNAGFSLITMVTNGVLMTQEIVKELAKKDVKVSINIDGRRDNHEFIRGKDTYENFVFWSCPIFAEKYIYPMFPYEMLRDWRNGRSKHRRIFLPKRGVPGLW